MTEPRDCSVPLMWIDNVEPWMRASAIRGSPSPSAAGPSASAPPSALASSPPALLGVALEAAEPSLTFSPS